MTNDEMNIAVAEACGWCLRQQSDGEMVLFNPDGLRVRSDYEPCLTLANFSGEFPDYTRDLNACHEMEKVLSCDQQDTYWCFLRHSVSAGLDDMQHCFNTLHSTAVQRAEAFLKTIGKWKEPSCTPRG